MATYKFYNVKAANTEIDRLTAALAQAESRISELSANEPETLAALTGEITALKETNSKLSSNAEAANKLAARVAELESKLAETEASVESRASAKALAITQSQGQPPVPQDSKAHTAADLAEQFQAITDPVEKTKFFRENRKALLSAVVRTNK